MAPEWEKKNHCHGGDEISGKKGARMERSLSANRKKKELRDQRGERGLSERGNRRRDETPFRRPA